MRRFLVFSFGYLGLAVALLFLLRGDVDQILLFAVAKARAEVIGFLRNLPWVLGVVAGSYLLFRGGFAKGRLSAVLAAFIGCLVFSAGYSLIKTTLPQIVPFYADPFLANLDRFLHFGNDPWRIAHLVSDYVTPRLVVTVYFAIWFLPGLFLPLFIAATDSNTQRVNRFVILYVFSWAFLGNILAGATMSGGPIFYDRLIGGTEFLALHTALRDTGIDLSIFGVLQQSLWMAFSENEQAVGSGISAFPSVHVAVACVIALYLAERSIWLLPVGLVFCAAILFISVYVGWHYAVDGYFSILLVVFVWFGLKQLQKQSSHGREKPDG